MDIQIKHVEVHSGNRSETCMDVAVSHGYMLGLLWLLPRRFSWSTSKVPVAIPSKVAMATSFEVAMAIFVDSKSSVTTPVTILHITFE